MSAGGWVPCEYMDEAMPPCRTQPIDWIERFADGWRLALPYEADPEWFRLHVLSDGDVVDFSELIEHGEIDVEISADGTHAAHGDVLDGECYCLPGDPDTFANSFDDFVKQYSKNMGAFETEGVTCAVYSWPATKFRFVVEDGAARFEALS